MKKKETPNFYVLVIFVIVAIWLSVCNGIQAYKCPDMTQTELFLHLPKSFIGSWQTCP